MTRKINVAILAGGRSSEHDVSRLSAMSIIEALDPARYHAVPVLIERSGDWRLTTARKLALPGAGTLQAPGTYSATVTMEVVAPDV